MTQYNWSWWFVLSVFWVLIHVLIAMMGDQKIMTHWFYMFGMILSLANLLFCIYIGNHPDSIED